MVITGQVTLPSNGDEELLKMSRDRYVTDRTKSINIGQ